MNLKTTKIHPCSLCAKIRGFIVLIRALTIKHLRELKHLSVDNRQ